jgi:aminoglycoside phosphotransferase
VDFGDGREDELLAAYGVAVDSDCTRYYRLLWDLTD